MRLSLHSPVSVRVYCASPKIETTAVSSADAVMASAAALMTSRTIGLYKQQNDETKYKNINDEEAF